MACAFAAVAVTAGCTAAHPGEVEKPSSTTTVAPLQGPSPTAQESVVPPWPAPRRGHGMASDGAGRLVIFGGRSLSGSARTYLSDTWLYDTATGTWTEGDAAPKPTPRSEHGMSWTGAEGEVLLIGGYTGSRFTYPDAWIFADQEWTRSDPINGPTPRAGSAVSWDEDSQVVVLFGGAEQPTVAELPTNETWILDPKTMDWANRSPVHSPLPRAEGHPTLFELALAYDSDSDRSILLIGGDETWAYDADTNQWEQRTPPGLAADFMVAAAYHPGLDRIITYGGGPTSLTAETWLYDYDTDTWTRVNTGTSPGPIGDHAMAYDSTTDLVYLFGGGIDLLPLDGNGDVSDELWAFDGSNWRRVGP